MRYKVNILDRIEQCNNEVNRINFEIGRNMDRQLLTISMERLKKELETMRDLISIEPDEFY